MLEKLVQSKKSNFTIDLNDNKNYTCWVLKEKNKEPVPNPYTQEKKNIISYGAVGLYLKKMEKSQQLSPQSNLKYYELRFNNLITDIFPFERNPEINFMYYNSQNENLFGNNYYESKKGNYEEKKMEALRKKMIDDDIPEMILYKYKNDIVLFKELMADSEDEPKFIFNILKENRKYKILSEKDTIKCIKDLIKIHKVELYDIPYIIKECQNIYSNIFTEEAVITVLSLYDSLYIQFKLMQRKIQKLNNQLLLTTNTLNNSNFSYNNDAKNELDLYLALGYLGFSISILNFNSKKKFCDNLLDLNVNLSSKKLLQSALEDECDKIVSKFCLASEDVAYNLKVLNTKAQNKLKEPNKECQLMDICTKKVYELARKNKKYHPIYLLQKAINFYIISLASNPYISKVIFSHYLKAATISTYPTEKGKVLLNNANPSFRVKKIEKQGLSKFIDNIKANENDFSEIYLDIEKCEKEGLIKCDIEIDMTSIHIKELIKLLNMAINGQKEAAYEVTEKNLDDKTENLSDSEETEFNKMKSDIKNNYLVRKIVIKNMILDKEFTQKYFINYVKKLCHNMAERYLIEKISNKFYNDILNKKYIRNKMYDVDDNDKYCYSIFFINLNTFCYIAVDKNKKIKYKNILKTEILSNQENDLKNEMYSHLPKYIILGINNIGSYKLINYFQENDSIIFSDYLSLLKIPKQYKINFANEKEYFYSIAYDQYKYTMNPLEFFIENYNFKYEKNLILNLKLHYLQEQINDIPLLNYCLETQIRRALNLYKFKYEKGKNPTENYYSFMNGLGPLTSKLIDDYKNRTLSELKNVTGENILKNIYPYIHSDNNMVVEEENNFVYHFQIEEIFNKMINSYYAIKKNSIYNVFVDTVDEKNKIITCALFYNENVLKCFLPFINIDEYITDIKGYFKKYKILLCKIINLQIDRGAIRIVLSNKIKDLEYFENSNEDQDDYNGIKYLREENKLIQIENLKNVVNYQKNLSECYLKKLNEEENEYIKNIVLDEIKKDYISIEESGKFLFRPSFLGDDHLILTLSFCENLTLNYNISKEKDGTYILENKSYQSLKEIVIKFVNPLLKLINEYKQNKYFKSPSKIEHLFTKIFNSINENNSDGNNKNYNANNNKYNENEAINFCFLNDSPNYGILITINKNNCVNLDYIEFSPEGFYFHNKLFENINLIIEYYLENNEKQFYKDFICENIISDSHSKLEYIDLKYKEFNDQMLTKLNWSLEPNDNYKEKEKKSDEIFLGKKREKDEVEFSGWGNDKSFIQKDEDIFTSNNNNQINSVNNENNNGSFWSNDKIEQNENNINKSWNDNSWKNHENNYSNNNVFNQDNNNSNYINGNSNNNNNNDNNYWNESNNANFFGGNNDYNNKNNNFYNNNNNNNNNTKNNNKFRNNQNNNNNYSNNINNNHKFNHNNRNGNNNRFNDDKKNNFNNRHYNNNKKYNKFNNNQESNFSWSVQPEKNNEVNEESNYNNNYNNSNDFWSNNQESEEANNSKIKDNNYENSVKQNHLEWSIYQENSQSNNANSSNNININNSYSFNISNNNKQNNNNNRFYKKNYFNNKNNDKTYKSNRDNYFNNRSPYKEKSSNNYFQQQHNNKNKGFNQRYDHNKFNKKKNLWANELNKNRKEDDIKTDENQGPIDFEKIDTFGGYNVNKGNQEQSQVNINGNTNDNNDQNKKSDEFW